MIKFFSKLGKFVSLNEIKWNSCSSKSSPKFGTVDSCLYIVSAEYEKGTAVLYFGITLEGEKK